MDTKQFWLYLAILSGSTYLIRAIPFVAVKEKIKNQFVQSFLYYIPYAVLTAMTIPAIFYATSSVISAAAGLIVAIILALKNKGLTIVAIFACLAVYLVEWLPFIQCEVPFHSDYFNCICTNKKRRKKVFATPFRRYILELII